MDERTGGFNITEAQEITDDVLAKNPQIDAILALNSSATRGAFIALENSHQLGRIKLVACEQELIPPLVTGEIDSIIVENTYEMGYRAIQLIAAQRRGEKVPAEIKLSPKLVTRENLNTPEVQRMLTMNWRAQIENPAWLRGRFGVAILAADGRDRRDRWNVDLPSQRQSWKLPYRDSFATGQADEWTAFGGTWQIANGAMRNDSDERGAKLMTGSPDWKDYSFSADVELLGSPGDAGLILRSSDEEQGVDSYRGYYVGLRNNDGNLIIGFADHGWIELAGTPMPGGVHALRWYHLTGAVHGCQITAYASEIPDGMLQTVSYTDKNCLTSGRIGLRSHSSGGAWKNLAVLPLTGVPTISRQVGPYHAPRDLAYAVDDPVMQRRTRPDHPGAATAGERDGARAAEAGTESAADVESIGSLRMIRTKGRHATVRGTVILTRPQLYVEDATGGVAVLSASEPNLKVGDEVEASGEVEVHDFSCMLRNASIRLLWAHAPAPPIAITASQAATGAYDARFIEVDGLLLNKEKGPDNTLLLAMKANGQSFRAIVNPSRGDAILRHLNTQSVLRMRGVCVVDPQFTHNLTPFVLLIASSDDVEELAGPSVVERTQSGDHRACDHDAGTARLHALPACEASAPAGDC